ncbi:MAG: translocation/assembly module TamB domain-containing protein [Candidatus Devosia phytovorans]|uniref:Translocation/assembly module TamB domain-containing protein n=1 Tax=Candidatus Devosia phytovorans TaxID=3121372 RepID=A0AAJ5VVQ3_9HYPH|nr:translocation/assembly module TamB domain-containing protein [Devosia sp.]WEK05035.1 MAG: translocation/assembly module TamB domain-containing protein [Devosia sp.]
MAFSFLRRLVAVALLSLGLAAPAVAQDVTQVLTMNNEEQKDWLTSFVQDRLSTPERTIRLSNIDGALGSNVSIREITISDAEGVWLRVTNASLTWNQAALFLGRLEVQSLKADSIDYIRNAVPVEGAVDLPPAEAGSFQVPEFPVAIILKELSVPTVTFGDNVFGLGSEISLTGALTLEGGNLTTNLDIVRLDGPGGTLGLDVAYTKADNNIDLGLSLVEPENGLIANLLNIDGRPAVTLNLNGSGAVTDLRTELELQANGQTALSGVATINQQADGIAINADLRGPLATLIAEPYRPFFGAETALTASALVRSEGGISISGLRLSGGQLSLEAAVDTTADNFLRRLTLNAVVADAAGGPVTLPVAGNATKVGSAQLAVSFGETGEDWSTTLNVTGFETDGFAAETLALNLGGVAANLSDPATRRVTFNGDGTLSGISGSEEIEVALGDGIGLGIAGLWNAGEPVQLAEFRIEGAALTAALTGELDGLDFNGNVGVETSSIAPFSGIAGRELNGGLSLNATGSIMPLSGGFDLTLDGTGNNLQIDDQLADGLLAGTVQLSGRVARTEAGLAAEQFRITNPQVQILADGTYSSALADFAFDLSLSDIALLSEQASGPLTVKGTAKGTAEAGIDLVLDADVPQGSLAERNLVGATLGFDGRYVGDQLDGTISGQAMLDGFRTSLAADVSVTPSVQALADLDFQAAGTRISGGLSRETLTGMITGGLSLVSPDVSVPAALALLEATGSVNAEINLAPADGKQGASLRGDVSDLLVNDIRVGAADISATIGDLFGVPVVDGTANASNISAAGVDVTTLTARANQNGTTTSFDAQAALATGTDVDIAGSLAPVEGGYRLALDRAALQQGQLSARLAQPTVLQVAGSSVSLDAVRFDVGSGSITASGSAGEALNLRLDVSALPLSIANTVAPDLDLGGTLNGRVTIGGTGSDPQVSFEAQVASVNAAAISSFGIAPLSAATAGSFRDGVVTLSSLSANGSGGLTISGSGRIPLEGNGLNLALTGSAPLALGNQFVADRGGQLSGTVNINAQVTGSLSSPQFGGRVSTAGAGYVDPELNARLQGITGSASLNGTSLSIDNLSAELSTGGSISASGTVGLSGGLPADIRVALNSARYADGNLFVATASGNLALTGNLTGSPLLSGDVLVEEANITVPESFGGGAQLIDVNHVRTPIAVEQTLQRAKIDDRSGAPIPQTRPAGVLLDVNVNAPNQIFIRGRGLDAEVGGSVRLTGPINNIQPVGGFDLNRGRLAILGQRITFESGSVTLVGDLDPFLDFVARTEGEDVTVFVTVSGRASDIDVSFTSSPALPQDEVLSRLIFNRSMGELSPLQLAKLAGAAAELVGGGNGLVDGLRGAAGLADLDVVTDDQGNVGVQAGTYIQDNVYLGVQAGANGQSKVTINLDVTDDFKVTGAAGQDGDSSLGVFYEKDY